MAFRASVQVWPLVSGVPFVASLMKIDRAAWAFPGSTKT